MSCPSYGLPTIMKPPYLICFVSQKMRAIFLSSPASVSFLPRIEAQTSKPMRTRNPVPMICATLSGLMGSLYPEQLVVTHVLVVKSQFWLSHCSDVVQVEPSGFA